MPEAAVNEYDAMESWKDQIRRAGQVPTVQTESKPHPMHKSANN